MVYLFTGPELGEKADSVDAIRDSLKKKVGEIEEYLFYGSETPSAEYISLLQNDSFFSSGTFVIVKGAETIKKKDEIALIGSFIKVKSDNNVLILESDEIKVDSALEKLISAANKKVFWEMFEARKAPYVTSLFTKRGYKITADAVAAILSMVENNTMELRRECEKFFIIYNADHIISEDDVEEVLGNTKEESPFTLFNAMATGGDKIQRLEKSLSVLQKLRLSKDNSSVMIIMALASCFRKVALWLKLKAAGRLDDLTLRQNGFSSKKQKEQYSAACSIWGPTQVKMILSLLSKTDMEIRKGGAGIEGTLLTLLIYQIVSKGGLSRARYERDDFIY